MKTKRMIRIFVSSTFSDLIDERNLLAERIFPRLGVLCRRNGFSFQIVDLRWGITDEDAQEGLTLQICFDEIARCQRTSAWPNFLVLSGFRYGWVPLPAVIPGEEWARLTGDLSEDSDEIRVLSGCFYKDYGSLRGDYVLKSGQEDNLQVKNILFALADSRFSPDDPRRAKYGLSATEQEICQGLFEVDGAKDHTLVIMRERVRDGDTGNAQDFDDLRADGKGNVDDAAQTYRLRRKLKDHMRDADGGEIIYYDTALNDERVEQVYRCLERMILEEIRQTEAELALKSTYRIEKDRLDAHQLHIRQIYQDYADNLEQFGRFCRVHGGEAVLLTGPSGNGKSTLLKKFYYEHDRTAGAFADVVLSCADVCHALWFVICQLEEMGCFSHASDPAEGKNVKRSLKADGFCTGGQPDERNCIRWFEQKLGMMTTEEPVIILLDSVEQMPDWKNVRGSLFDIFLPKNVTIVVSCISTDSLRACDAQKQLSAYVLQNPALEDAVKILDRALALSDRKLTNAQEAQIRAALPVTITPLYMQILAVRCRQVRSRSEEQCLPFTLPADEWEGLSGFLEELGREYPVLSRRALGYLAVSENGLAEQELLELLSTDEVVKAEVKNRSKWDYQTVMQTITVPWSRLFHNMQEILTEAESDGLLLLRFSHSLIARIVRETLTGDERESLLKAIQRYFEEQSDVYSGVSPDMREVLADAELASQKGRRVLPNVRKIDELYPAIVKRADWGALGRLLSRLSYADACVRAERYAYLMKQYAMLQEHGSLTRRQEVLQRLLRQKRLLLSNWPDSFPGLAAGAGLYTDEKELKEIYGVRAYISGETLQVRAGDLREDAMYLPEVMSMCVGVKSGSPYFAVKKDAEIRIYDWDIRAFTGIVCAVPKGQGKLYWMDDRLILRMMKRRITMRFVPEKAELYIEKDEVCPHWDYLLLQNRDEMTDSFRKAGGMPESDLFFTESSIFTYFYHGQANKMELFYPYGTELLLSRHGAYAAVILDHKMLQLVNLTEKRIWAEYRCPGAKEVFWDEEGKDAMVVFEDGYLSKIDAQSMQGKTGGRPLPQPLVSAEEHERLYNRQQQDRWLAEVPDLLLHPVHKHGMPYKAAGNRQLPALAAFSVEYNWLAVYYYSSPDGYLRLYRYDTRTLYAECRVEPVYQQDAVRTALFASRDKRSVVLRTGGKLRSWDTQTLVWSRVGEAEDWMTNAEADPVMTDLKANYIKMMQSNRAQAEQEPTKALMRILDLLSRLMHLVPRMSLYLDQAELAAQGVEHVPVIRLGNIFWILNRIDNTVHVCDAEGRYLCHEAFGFPVAAYDICGDRIYALPEDLSEAAQRRLQWL